MESKQISDETVLIPKSNSKGKAVVVVDAAAPVEATTPNATLPQGGKWKKGFAFVRRLYAPAAVPQGGRWKKGLAIVDFVLRLCTAAAALAAASIMGYAEEILPFFTQFFQFHVQYTDLPTFQYFVAANAAAGGYLVLSLPFSIVCIVRPHAVGPRRLLLILDAVMLAAVISSAGAATAIVYLAHNGNLDSNWLALCQQYSGFCQQASAGVVASFVTAVMFIVQIANSALALKRTSV